MRLATHEVTIAAPAATVWELLTTAEGLVRWVGPEATVVAEPGGALRWMHANGATVVGEFVELDPRTGGSCSPTAGRTAAWASRPRARRS